MRKNKSGFTLIELIVVLVIIAIIALIVTPLVMRVVDKAQDSANKRSVDGYGKSIEIGIANYLLDNGEYPKSVDDLNIEYTGSLVECSTRYINDDGSVYLSKCRVDNTNVKDASTDDGYYHYGKTTIVTYDTYEIGDMITYNGMLFYVIENSDEKSDRVTMLKAEPLTVDEVNKYGGVGTDNNHVNMYVYPNDTYYQTAYDYNGYGGMAYCSSETCGYNITDGCTTDYAQSELKYVVDAWATDKINTLDLIEDKLGYKTRLITYEDLTNNLGYSIKDGETRYTATPDVTPSWVYNSNYSYWTMSGYGDSTYLVRYVYYDGGVDIREVNHGNYVVRPVITIKKTAI